MTIYTLSHGSLKLDVSDQGGVIEGFWRDTTPLLRPGKKSGVATDASCFPLVPFANRVSGNRFVWQGREYQLQPNVEWDAHYLHGDGWLGEWQCVSHSDDSLCLVYEHRSGVYHYRVSQAFHLTGGYADGDALCHQSRGRDAAIWYRLASLFSVVAANADSGTGERLLAGAGAVAGG